jgi:hypothetical protein
MRYSNHEDDDDDSEQETNSYPDTPRLSPHEYVVARINIRLTLGTEFYRLATYYKTPGTFPLDSDEAVSEAWRLVDQFLTEYEIPGNGEMSEWSCPRFVPQSHLMLVSSSYGSWRTRCCAEILPAVVAPAGTSLTECHFINEKALPAYAPVHTSSQRYNDPVLVTDPPLLPHKAVYQNANMKYFCTVGSVKEGPQVFLRLPSVEVLKELDLKYQKARTELPMSRLPSPDCGQYTPCHCHTRTETAKRFCTATLGDIVLDFDRSAVEAFGTTETSSRKLTFEQECHRIMALLDDWVDWIYAH